jgi:hypothetical protein
MVREFGLGRLSVVFSVRLGLDAGAETVVGVCSGWTMTTLVLTIVSLNT